MMLKDWCPNCNEEFLLATFDQKHSHLNLKCIACENSFYILLNTGEYKEYVKNKKIREPLNSFLTKLYENFN